MKKLFFALICTAIGFSASASDLSPKKEVPTTVRVETFKKPNELKTITIEQAGKAEVGSFRRQMNFTFTDACGQQWVVYVSGPNNASNATLWHTAFNGFMSQVVVKIDGCL